MFTLAGIFRRFWPGYRAKFRQDIPAAHVRAAEAVLRCRTPEAGMVYYRCGDCGKVEPHPVSCGHRACNACGQHHSKEWEARQKARLLPVPYHMITFTVPSEFRELFRRHQKLCYTLLFRESAGALGDLAADPQHLGGELGMSGILQTWTRDLRYHPHIHYLVPGGALTSTGWVRPRHPNILVPAKPLAVRMRNRFRSALKAAEMIQSPPHGSFTPAGQLLRRCLSQPLPGASAQTLPQPASPGVAPTMERRCARSRQRREGVGVCGAVRAEDRAGCLADHGGG